MQYLPWEVLDTNPRIIVDSKGCQVVDLSGWGVVGKGHDPTEIAKLIVYNANKDQLWSSKESAKDLSSSPRQQ